MDGWVSGQIDKWTDGRMDGQMEAIALPPVLMWLVTKAKSMNCYSAVEIMTNSISNETNTTRNLAIANRLKPCVSSNTEKFQMKRIV